jgi:hypothetical protein
MKMAWEADYRRGKWTTGAGVQIPRPSGRSDASSIVIFYRNTVAFEQTSNKELFVIRIRTAKDNVSNSLDLGLIYG